MKRTIFLLSILLFTGCGKDDKKDNGPGPRITGGGPVDNKVGPVKPSVGGEVKPAPQ